MANYPGSRNDFIQSHVSLNMSTFKIVTAVEYILKNTNAMFLFSSNV